MEEELKKNGVESYSLLPASTRAQLDKIYNRARGFYRAMYRAKVAQRQATGSGLSPSGAGQADEDENEEDGTTGEDGVGGGSVDASGLETEGPLDRIDDFPDAAHAGGDALEAAHVSCNSHKCPHCG